MKYEVYCDESQPDALWSKSRRHARYLLIGGLWIPARRRAGMKSKLNALKKKHGYPGELKWHKVHAGKADFYKAVVDLFIDAGSDARFRCVAIEADKVNLARFHSNDRELGFYKFYYQMLVHWMAGPSDYRVFCDMKTNRVRNQLSTIKRILNRVCISASVEAVQALPSREVVLLQLADFLLGMASSRLNQSVRAGAYKDKIIRHLEQRLRRPRLGPTPPSESKFNIFRMDLDRGW